MLKRLFLIVAVLQLVACSQSRQATRTEYREQPANAMAVGGIEKVAVVILNATQEQMDAREASQIFSVELQQVKGIKVFPAAVAQAAVIQEQIQLPEQAHVLARKLGVDAVIVGFITDYQPYDYPRVGILLMVYPAAKEDQPAGDAVVLHSLNRVYDSNNEAVFEQVRAFAARRDAQRTPLGENRHLLVTSEYMHFVADRSFRDLFGETPGADLHVAQAE